MAKQISQSTLLGLFCCIHKDFFIVCIPCAKIRNKKRKDFLANITQRTHTWLYDNRNCLCFFIILHVTKGETTAVVCVNMFILLFFFCLSKDFDGWLEIGSIFMLLFLSLIFHAFHNGSTAWPNNKATYSEVNCNFVFV